jgi:uncharacterized protein (DUF983 family)
MSETTPSLLPSIVKMKCPNCRKGRMFKNRSIFPLSELMQMPEHCEVCGQKFELEVGFYYGTGYVSYGLSVLLLIFVWLAYWLVLGLSYKDNSVFYCILVSSLILIVLQPWLMRLSRVLYLNLFVHYGKGTTIRSEQ